MKYGAIVRCYHITDWLKPVLRSLEKVDKLLVINYRFNTAEEREDKTEEIVRSMGLNNVIFLKGAITINQSDIFNSALEILSDCDFVFINDADEIMLWEDRMAITQDMEYNSTVAGYADIIDYAYSFFTRFKKRSAALVVVRNNKSFKFHNIRCVNTPYQKTYPYTLHHFGFVYPEEKLKWKFKWEAKEEGLPDNNWDDLPLYKCEIPEEILKMVLNENSSYCKMLSSDKVFKGCVATAV